MSLKNDLYRGVKMDERLIELAKARAAAKVQAMKEELPTERDMRHWHEGLNPMDRSTEEPYPAE